MLTQLGPVRTWPNLGQSGGILSPTPPQVGANWSCWAEIGPKAIQTGPKLKPCDAHGNPSHIQSGASWDPLATASHQVGPNRDTTWGTLRQRKRHQQQKTWEMPVKTGVLRILYWASFVPTLKQYGPQLGPKLLQTVQVGAKLRHRPKLEPSGSKLGPSWARWSIWPMLGRYAKFANYHSRVHFFADGSIRATHFLDISTSTHGPNVMCFWHFDFDMCVVPQRRHFFDISSSKSGPMLKCF